MNMTDRATLTRLERDGAWWLVKFSAPPDVFQETVSWLKTLVPPEGRTWDKDARAWRIGERYLPLLAPLFDNFVERYTTAQRESSRSTQRTRLPAPVADALRTLCLAEDAPSGLVAAARRYWARELHPDHGGDLERMKAVNAAADIALAWLEQPVHA